MYPNLYFLFQDLFGIEISALKLVNSFGLMVALAFVVASALLRKELLRKEKEGLMKPTQKQVWVGKAEGPLTWISSALLGFLLGWKVLWLLLNASDLFTGISPPQRHCSVETAIPCWAFLAPCVWRAEVARRHEAALGHA